LVEVVEVPVRSALETKVHALQAEVAQLQGALTSRIVIEQAKGQLSITHGVAVDAAFETLRGHARSKRRNIHEVADEVVRNGGEFLAPAPRSKIALADEVHRLLLRAADAAEALAKLAPSPAVAQLKRSRNAPSSLARHADLVCPWPRLAKEPGWWGTSQESRPQPSPRQRLLCRSGGTTC
jgi:hypothetical protein